MSTTDGNNNDQCGGGGEEITSNKEESTSCEQNNVDNIAEGINSIAVRDDNLAKCASCGVEGTSGDMNTCNRCKEVKYCNAACKKKHRTKHKKKCDRRVAELHEEALFKEPPPREECPICMLPLPLDGNQSTIKSCCGKMICNGCSYAMLESEGKHLCAFCRTPPTSSDEERLKQLKKLMDKGNAYGFYQLAGYYGRGICGLPRDFQKTIDLWLKAAELGFTLAYFNLGNVYLVGTGVEVDERKAKHYHELAAIGGNVSARYELGTMEGEAGNMDKAMKHYIIAAKAGYDRSLDEVKRGYKGELITKDEYADILRAYQERQEEMKSNERDKAAKVLALAASLEL